MKRSRYSLSTEAVGCFALRVSGCLSLAVAVSSFTLSSFAAVPLPLRVAGGGISGRKDSRKFPVSIFTSRFFAIRLRFQVYQGKDFFCQLVDVAALDELTVWRQERGTEQGFASLLRAFLAETLAVGQVVLQDVQAHLSGYFLIDFVQVGLFPSVHHVPQQVQPFDIGLTRADKGIVHKSGERQRTGHDHTVCRYRAEDIVHRGDGLDDTVVVYRTRKVEENDIRRRTRIKDTFDGLDRFFGMAFQNRICPFVIRPCELLIGEFLQVGVVRHVTHIALPHVLDAELGIVAVHDRHIVPLYIVEVTRHQHGQCRFARSSLLGGESHKQCFFFHTLYFLIVHTILWSDYPSVYLSIDLSANLPDVRPTERITVRLANLSSVRLYRPSVNPPVGLQTDNRVVPTVSLFMC
ncbi:unknown [Eggerthella sp. CAG:1427]|nr:unknown [Eggerthella sp. CAG:1427]